MGKGHGGKRPGAGRKPGPVTKAMLDVKAAAQEHAELAIQVLAEIAREGDSASARVSAANSILDRAFGRPKQTVETTGADGGPIQTEDVTDRADAFTRTIAGLAARAAEDGGAEEAGRSN